MQFFLVYTYTFIKRNFFFFFGTIETTCIAPVKKKQILPVSESPKTTRRTYIRAGEVKKIFWCLLQKKLNQKKNIRVFSRDVFES